MANELQTKLDAILLDKNTNLLPENLKKGVTLLGVEGNLETGGSTGAPVKLFETQEEMQADTTAKEGDLAVVYRSEVKNATVDSKFQVATFPDTVVLDTAITDYVEVRYRAVDSSKSFDCMGSLDSSNFMMDCHTETGNIRIQYTSSDGITYTRTDSTGNPVDFGCEIYYEMSEMWNDVIGKFIQIGGNKFDGLYEYTKEVNSSKINFANINSLVFGGDNLGDYDATATEFTTLTITQDLINLIRNNISMSDWNWGQVTVWFQDENVLRIAGYVVGAANCPMMAYFDENKNFLGINNSSHSTTATLNYADVNLTNMTVSTGTLSANENGVFECGLTLPNLCVISTGEFKASEVCDSSYFFTSNYTAGIKYSYNYIVYNYQIAPTQLSAIADYVYEKEFYGKNGVETGTLTQDISNSFTDMNAEVYGKIQNYYDNLEQKVLTDDDKTIDKNIYCIPVKKDGTVLLNTSSVTNMAYMFLDCTNLQTIPLLDTSNVTNMGSMFNGCTNLTTIPLLNTSSATNMNFMFNGCTNLLTIPLLDTSSVTSMSNMFRECTNLPTIPLLNTSKVTDMTYMFQSCTNLTEIPLLDTSNVTNMSYMLSDCTNLTTIPLLNTSSATNMNFMLSDCTNLTEIPLLDTSNVTNMSYMLSDCTNLAEIPLLNTSKVTNMRFMLSDCTNLSDESLNNILTMCINATSYKSTKTLKYIGLTSEQATKCTTLSNYSAFTAAGWTTGY